MNQSTDLLLQKMKELSYDKSLDGIYTTLEYNGRKKKVSVNDRLYVTYITKMYFEETGEIIEEKAIRNCLKLIAFDLEFEEKTYADIYSTRYICKEKSILIDIGNEELECVKVSDGEYEIIDADNMEVRFCNDSMRKPMQVIPLGELDLSESLLINLDKFINLSEDDLFLLKVWLVTSMNPNINCPITYLLGGAGTGKSSMQRMITEILDPNSRGLVNWDETSNKDLAIMLNRSHLINFDNVSRITAKKSDLLCQSVTGGNFSVRKLYTDNDEINYNLKSRIIISSVENCIDREDLSSRVLYMNVPKLRNKGRIEENELMELFEEERPQIISELLTILALSLEEYPEWKKTHKSFHRLAGFEVFGSLVATILDEENGYSRFMRIIKEKYIQQMFPEEVDRIFIYNFFETLDVEFHNDYDGGTKRLYDSVCNWIIDSPDCSYPTEVNMNYDRFAKMLHQKKTMFMDLGYDLEFKKIISENVSAIRITKVDEDDKAA